MTARQTLSEVLEQHDLLHIPGVWDGLSAALADRAGFEAVCTSGFAISAALGLPDADLYSQAENLQAVRTVARGFAGAIMADIDYGYGNAVNVFHTVRDFEAAGASAVFMEDQVAPKRCNYCVGDPRELIDMASATSKIRAAVAARQDERTIVVARTDAEGEEIFRRAEAYVQAGAHMILPIAARPEFDTASWAKLGQEIGVPLVAALVPDTWQDAEFTDEVLREIGVAIAIDSLHPLYAAARAMSDSMARLRTTEPRAEISASGMPHSEFAELIGFPAVNALQERFQ